jgi:RHS repeat-associated protein
MPASGISDVRTTYDGGTVGSAPTKGDATKSEEVDSYSGSTPHWATSNQTTYDSLGRPLQVTDVLGHTTTTAYTPASSGPLTSTTSTNTAPFNWTTTTAYDPRWGVATSSTDPNGEVTTSQYDGLGRLSRVWLTDHPYASNPNQPSIGYAYTLSTTAANAVETSTLGAGTVVNSYDLYDGLGRQVQSQTAAEGTGATITDTAYNMAGETSYTDSAYWTSSVSPSTTLFVPTNPINIPSRTVTSYDGDGRTITSALYGTGTLRSQSTYAYPGADETDVTPPSGGTPTSTFINSLGEKTKLVQYLAATVSPTATEESTTYGYNPQGQMTSMTDPAGNAWSWGFDVLGQQTSAVDPDTGTTSTTYDDAGDVLTTTDARGDVLAYTYDNLGRKTGEYRNSTGSSGILLDSWTYDTLEKGQPSVSTSYTGSTAGSPGLAYTDTVNTYDTGYRPTSETIAIPTGAPAFGGTSYNTRSAYDAGGALSAVADPAEGGLPAETVRTSYDGDGNAVGVAGTNTYEHSIFTPISQLAEQDRSGTTSLSTDYGYDSATGDIDQIMTTTQTGSTNQTLENNTYGYDPAGEVTSIAMTSTVLASGETQCFNYDHLQDLTSAWTPTDGNCSEAPTSSTLGGVAPYWDNYTVDPATGNRLSETSNAVSSGGASTTSTYNYPTAGSSHPHAVQEVDQASGSTTNPSDFSYDADGNTTSRPGQTLTYDATGKVASATEGTDTENNVYSASGNLLLQTDSGTGSTLFLGDTELHVAHGSTTATGTRTYSANGNPVAERTTTAGVSGNVLTWLSADDQGTVDQEVVATTGAITTREFDPFGQTIGSASTWSDDHGFLNAADSAQGDLTLLGAREYDPSLGKFLSADPLLDPSNPQQVNGYSYSDNSPVSNEDPSGLMFEGDGGTNAPPSSDSSTTSGKSPKPAGNSEVQLSPHMSISGNSKNLSGMERAWQFFTDGKTPSTEQGEMDAWAEVCFNSGDLQLCDSSLKQALEPYWFSFGRVTPLSSAAAAGGIFYFDQQDSNTPQTFQVDDSDADGGSDVVYRALADGEALDVLHPTDINADTSVQDHVWDVKPSPWISTSKDYWVALNRYGGGDPSRVVEIRLSNQADTTVIRDISDGANLDRESREWAINDQEVLLSGANIPTEGVAVPPFGGGNGEGGEG